MSNSVLSQNVIEAIHDGQESNSILSQVAVQVLLEAPIGIRFTAPECTDLGSKKTLLPTNSEGVSWAILNNSNASAVTSILDQNNNLNISDGEGYIATPTITPGSYIVIVQDSQDNIGAYVMDAN